MTPRPASASAHASLRGAARRLTLQFTGLMALLLITVCGLVFVLFKVGADAATERALLDAAELSTAQITPGGAFVTVIQGGTVMTADGLPAGLVDMEAARQVAGGAGTVTRERTAGGRDYTTRTTLRGDRVVQVTAEEHRNEEDLRRLASVLALAGAVAFGLAVLASSVMARRAIRPMAEALAVQRRFVAEASHELRTPLTLLSTRAQLLSRRPRDDVPLDVAESLDEMMRDSRTVTRILDDLLVAADPRSDPAGGTVDLVAVADAVIASMGERARARRVTLERSGAAERAVIRGSDTAMARLYVALLANALDFATTKVTVRIDVDGRSAVVEVLDDGPGFARGLVPHAFEPFVTGRPAAAAPDSGAHSGLGLAVVAEIVRRHRGRVRIEDAEEHGRVVLRLPLLSGRDSGHDGA